jgi:hypothetical protein
MEDSRLSRRENNLVPRFRAFWYMLDMFLYRLPSQQQCIEDFRTDRTALQRQDELACYKSNRHSTYSLSHLLFFSPHRPIALFRRGRLSGALGR